VMSAIERCRTVALGGHVARCEDCAHTQIAYNSLYGDSFVKLSMFRPSLGSTDRQQPPVGTTRGEPAIGRKASRRDLVCGWIRKGPGP
jgi:hypothetical protein